MPASTPQPSDSPRSRSRAGAPSRAAIRRQALEFLIDTLAGGGLRAEAAPNDIAADVIVELSTQRSVSVRLLAAAAPHRRGGRGDLGLHWMLPDTSAEFVALIDISRPRGWLMPAADFRARAQPMAGGRFHLDWIVAPLGKTRSPAPDEEEFAQYAFRLGGQNASLVLRRYAG